MKILVIQEVSYVKKPVNEFQDFSESLSSIGHDVSVIDLPEPLGPMMLCIVGIGKE